MGSYNDNCTSQGNVDSEPTGGCSGGRGAVHHCINTCRISRERETRTHPELCIMQRNFRVMAKKHNQQRTIITQFDNITGIQLLETAPTPFSYIFSRRSYSRGFRNNHSHNTGMFITKVSSLCYSNSSVLFGAFSKIWVIEDSRAAGCQHNPHLKNATN